MWYIPRLSSVADSFGTEVILAFHLLSNQNLLNIREMRCWCMLRCVIIFRSEKGMQILSRALNTNKPWRDYFAARSNDPTIYDGGRAEVQLFAISQDEGHTWTEGKLPSSWFMSHMHPFVHHVTWIFIPRCSYEIRCKNPGKLLTCEPSRRNQDWNGSWQTMTRPQATLPSRGRIVRRSLHEDATTSKRMVQRTRSSKPAVSRIEWSSI